MRNCIKLIILSFFIILSGCAFDHNPKNTSNRHEIEILKNRLNNLGVKVVENKESIKFFLSNQYLFVGNSANLARRAYKPLDLILGFSNYLNAATIAVTDYSNNVKADDFSLSLAKERARKVVEFFKKAKIKSSLVYANGKITITDCLLIEFIDFYQ